jgi:hypothetical protein
MESIDSPFDEEVSRQRSRRARRGDYTFILFKHQGWKEPVEFMHHCSLKLLFKTGKGAPDPHDVKVDNWN